MRTIATIAASAAFVLVACEPMPSSYSGNSPSTAYRAVDLTTATIKNDSYSPTIQVKTDEAERGAPGYGRGTEAWALIAKIDKQTGAVVSYVQWLEVYWDKEWRFFSRASTNKGQSLSFDTVDRSVSKCSSSGCIYSETYNIMMPAAELRSGAKDGINFKIYSKTGAERVISIPAEIVAQFNEKVVEAQKMRKA